MQINLTGFLNAKNARTFLTELWDLLCSAQENDTGIPTQFLEQKKEEIKKRQVGAFNSSCPVHIHLQLKSFGVHLQLKSFGVTLAVELEVLWCKLAVEVLLCMLAVEVLWCTLAVEVLWVYTCS